MGVGDGDGVPVSTIEFVVSSGDEIAANLGSLLDVFEQPVPTINRANKSDRLIIFCRK